MPNWKNYKIIFSDFDGTLVGSDFQPSTELKTAIAKWQNQGKIFSVVTGKPFIGVLETAVKHMKITGPIIVNGGAVIIDPQLMKIISEEFLPSDSVTKIITLLNSKKIAFEVRTNKYNYASGPKMKIYKPFRDYLDISKLPINIVSCFRIPTNTFSPSIIEMIKKELENTFPDLFIIEGNAPNAKGIQISSKHSSKHIAILKIINMLKIAPEETIGIGDEMNDYPLLTACGYKVVMENGNKDLKAIADEIIPSYQDNGVAKFINKIL